MLVNVQCLLTSIKRLLLPIIIRLCVSSSSADDDRHPQEVGGLYFSLSLPLSQMVLWVGILLYDGNEDGLSTKGNKAFSSAELFNLGRILSIAWVASIVIIVVKCKKEYRRTFFSTATAKKYQKDTWDWQKNQTGLDEKAIAGIFKCHPDTYKHFDNEVREWLGDNWERWQREKPECFTKKLIASIPESVMNDTIREEAVSLMGTEEHLFKP